MTNKFFMGVAVVGLVFLGMLALKAPAQAPSGDLFGAVTASNALNQQRLITEFTNVAAPLVAIESTTTASIDFTNLTNASGTSAQSTTTAAGMAGSLNDVCLASPVTDTSGAFFGCKVSTASTTSATLTIVEFSVGGAAVDATNTAFSVKILPSATFVAPTSL